MHKPIEKRRTNKPVHKNPVVDVKNPAVLPQSVKDALLPAQKAVIQMILRYVDNSTIWIKTGEGDAQAIIDEGVRMKSIIEGLNTKRTSTPFSSLPQKRKKY